LKINCYTYFNKLRKLVDLLILIFRRKKMDKNIKNVIKIIDLMTDKNWPAGRFLVIADVNDKHLQLWDYELNEEQYDSASSNEDYCELKISSLKNEEKKQLFDDLKKAVKNHTSKKEGEKWKL